MIAKFFNKTIPINTLMILVFTTFIFISAIFSLIKVDFTAIFFLKKGGVLALLLLTLLVINFIVSKNGLVKENSFVLLLVAFCVGMFPFSAINGTLLITHLLLLLAYRRIYSLRTLKDTKEKIFDSSLWIGIATLIYPWSFMYLLLVYAGIYMFRKSTLRNVLIPIIGFLTPIFLYGIYLLLIGTLGNFNLELNYSFSFLTYNSLKLLLPVTLILGYMLWAIFPMTVKVVAINNEFRMSWFLLLVHLIISIIVILFSPNKDGSEFLFIFFPISIILANYLKMVKEKWFREVFLYLFLLIMIAVYFL